MRRRVVVLCTVLAVLVGALALLGCGEPDEDTTSGSLILTVYTSGTLQGDGRQAAQDGADAVKLALDQANGMVGPFSVNVVSLDDTDPDTGRWGADQAVTNARRAIADRNIMGYIADSGSGRRWTPAASTAGWRGLSQSIASSRASRLQPPGRSWNSSRIATGG